MSCQSGMFSENLFSLLSFKLPVSFCCYWAGGHALLLILEGLNYLRDQRNMEMIFGFVPWEGGERRGGRDQSNFVHTAVKCDVMQCSDVLYRLQIFYSYLAVLYERNTNCDPKISLTCNSVTHLHPKCILIHLVFPKSCCLQFNTVYPPQLVSEIYTSDQVAQVKFFFSRQIQDFNQKIHFFNF